MKNKIVFVGIMGAILGAGAANAAPVQKEVATVDFVRGGVANAKAYANTVAAGKQTATVAGDSGKVLVGGATAGTFGTARGIDTTVNGTAGSADLITSGAVRATYENLELTKENAIKGELADDGKALTWDAGQKKWIWAASGGENKADKAIPSVAGNLATLGADGNLVDAGFGIVLSSDTYSE